MKETLISVIILNWNGKEIISNCLNSILHQSYSTYEIIVIDNGSTDGSLELIKENFSSAITLIKNKENVGFAEGVNIGIKHSKGEWIALLNNDATVEPNWLEEISQGIENPDVGMCASKVYLHGKEGILDNTGLAISKDGQNRARGRLEKDTGQYDQSEDVLCPSGCAALYKKEMLERIDFFDKDLFAYGDDIEVGLKGRLLGYQAIYKPKAIAYHELSKSTGVVSEKKVYLVERNRLWLVLKCFPLPYLLLSFLCTPIRYFYLCYGLLAKKGPSHQYSEKNSFLSLFVILIRVYWSTLLHLPNLLNKRRRLMQKLSSKQDFGKLLKDYSISLKEAALAKII